MAASDARSAEGLQQVLQVPGLPARYRVYRELGRGGQGVVYLAHDDVLDTDVALKMLHANLADDADVVERLRREGVLTRRIAHSGVCHVHDLVHHEDTVFLVMDYVDGTPLAIEIYKDPPAPAEAVRIVRDAARAVAAAHAVGIVHRDLKPQNILVRPDGSVVVVDFGVATARDLPKMTDTGQVVGTRAYIAPEIWLGAPATPLADVFAMGVILYEALTGNVPYGDVDESQIADAVPPSQRKPEIPRWLDVVTAKAMAPLPKDRFQSMRAFADALDAGEAGALLLANDTIENPPARRARSGRRVALLAALAAAAAGLAVAAGVALSERRGGSPALTADAGAAPLVVTPVDAASAAPPDAGDNAAAAAVTPAPPPRGASTSLTAHRRAALSELTRARSNRQLLPRDVPALDRAIDDVRRARSEGAVDDALASGKRAVEAVKIDAAFLDRKLQRLNAAYAGLDAQAKQRVSPKLSSAASLLGSRKYVEANRALNEGFAAIRP